MTFDASISACFAKYADVAGRASRPEFWWWILFLLIATCATAVVDNRLCDIIVLATLLPTIAVTTRRLHDTDRSGWWQLIQLLPVLGSIVLIVFCCQASAPASRYERRAVQA